MLLPCGMVSSSMFGWENKILWRITLLRCCSYKRSLILVLVLRFAHWSWCGYAHMVTEVTHTLRVCSFSLLSPWKYGISMQPHTFIWILGMLLYLWDNSHIMFDAQIILNKVLLVSTRDKAYIGMPVVTNAAVHAIVEEQVCLMHDVRLIMNIQN